MTGSVQRPMALRRKIAPVATAMLDALAPIEVPTAAMAEPPQIAVPEVMSVEISRPVPRSRPSSMPTAIAPKMVPTASASPASAEPASMLRSRRKPRRTTQAWMSHLEMLLVSSA